MSKVATFAIMAGAVVGVLAIEVLLTWLFTWAAVESFERAALLPPDLFTTGETFWLALGAIFTRSMFNNSATAKLNKKA